ncbi:MAG: transglycosylase domain-containing protein [Chloroflexi bacterium]|nr:transglycosylase domain-containing protein [Chloroflexota bacterium]MCY4247556.1 transglycosylase domain-containing protein [Chloroflexota bacterium]
MPALAHIIRRRSHRKRRQKQNARRSTFQTCLFVGLPLALLAAPLAALLALSVWLYISALSVMPTPQQTALADSARITQYTDRHGAALQTGASLARWLPLDELPAHLVAVSQLIAAREPSAERTAFNALDTLAQLSAYILDLPLQRDDSRSAQLVRSNLLPQARSGALDKRLLELVFSAEIKRTRNDRQLLEWQLNSQSFGGILGIEAASQQFLGKPAAQLSVAEAALLTALAAQPPLDPVVDAAQVRARAAELLRDMPSAGQSDRAQAAVAELDTLLLRDPATARAGLNANLLAVASAQAKQLLNSQGLDGRRLVDGGGLTITTTLDLAWQRRAAESFATSVIIDARTGEILSLVGEATQANRQPAGILQPFVYMDAFARRTATPATMLYDISRAYPDDAGATSYTPANTDGEERGPLSLREALSSGLLPPAVQVASETGLPSALQLAGRLGFNSLGAQATALTLLEGGGGVSVLEAAYAYSVIAALGEMHGAPTSPASQGLRGRNPVAVLRIVDAAGQLLWQYDAAASRSALIQPSLAYLVNDILSGNLGEASRATAQIKASSADGRDHWLLRYSPDMVLAAHSRPAQTFADSESLLEWAHQQRSLPARDWLSPPDIEEYLVCEISGMLPATTDHCPVRREIVPANSQLLPDDRWQRIEINSVTGQLASVNTPDNLRATQVYFVPPDEILDWWQEKGKPLPPSSYSSEGVGGLAKAARLLAPSDFAYVGARVDIQAKIVRPGARSWRLEYGAGADPESWLTISQSQRIEADGELRATWETALLSGIHTLRLVVDFADGSQESDSKLLTFDNTPPAITLDSSESARVGETFTLVADARDNLAIDRVEFYRGDERLGSDSDWRYSWDVAPVESGETLYRALVYDQVGNRAQATLTIHIAD